MVGRWDRSKLERVVKGYGKRRIYDGLDFMQQVGALPRAEGIGFKALVLTDILAGKAMGQAGALFDRARHAIKR